MRFFQFLKFCFGVGILSCAVFVTPAIAANGKKPVLIGLDAEFGNKTSTSATAIERGISIAIDEINQKGGVLGGRELKLETRDNRSVPARGVTNVKELAELPDLVAVFTGKFSPVAQEIVPVIHQLKIPLLDPWAAADDIIDNGQTPNFAFRLSLRDQWALETILKNAKRRNLTRVGLMLPNTGWGRSSLNAAKNYTASDSSVVITKQVWYNWGDKTLVPQYEELLASNAQVILFVGNEKEGSIFVTEMSSMPKDKQRPIISHWGVTGGNMVELSGQALSKIDFSVVQTYSFIGKTDPVATKVIAAYKAKYGVKSAREIESPVGVAHGYELTHILASAIEKAGSTNREAVRDALENLPSRSGLFGVLNPPFSKTRHEALNADIPFIARFASDGAIEPVSTK